MKARHDAERINKRCEKLEEMGFNIKHEDSCVELGGYEFDFSSIDFDDMESFLRHTIATVSQTARHEGRMGALNNIRRALFLPDYT